MSDEPESVRAARAVVAAYEERGVCPNIARAHLVCVWTCTECHLTMQPTHATHVNGGARRPLVCHLRRGSSPL